MKKKLRKICTAVSILLVFLSIILFLKYAVFKESYKFPNANVILISIDTLRSDHLGCYGYRNTTPNIDRFSKNSILFKNCIAHVPSTASSHASIFTSLILSHHGVSDPMKRPLPQEIVTMAEILKENRYKTISYNGGGQVAPEFGLDQGFDLYEKVNGKFIDQVTKSIDWIKNNPNEKFFLFLHTYEVHHAYSPEKQYLDLFEKDYSGDLPAETSVALLKKINKGEIILSREDVGHIINTYDAEIYSMDRAFGILIDFLKKEGLYEGAMIILTSDHGEEFGEHGMMGWHSNALYDEQLKVPLVIKLPNSKYASTIVDEQVRGIDILPSLLDVLDVPSLKIFEGVSLISRLKSEKNDELFAVSQLDTKGQRHPTSIRTKKWKLYGSKLFDLEKDPLEKIDVSKKHKEIKRYLRKNLNRILQQREIITTEEETEIDEDTLEQLKSLGYIN